MRYIRQAPNQNPPKKGRTFFLSMEDELFDLTSMAMEYFKEHIEPTLPEITYFGADFLDFTSTFASKALDHVLTSTCPFIMIDFSAPTKRRSVSGSTSILGTGLDSPCSSRASVAGSSVSEVWSTTSTSVAGSEMMDMDSVNSAASSKPPQSNMVLRKRIRRIRQGMKRYNDQLVEVKKELKTCKTKMESQSKQVHEYSQRLEGYDKKFEESSRKFQTLLTVRINFWLVLTCPFCILTLYLYRNWISARQNCSIGGQSPQPYWPCHRLAPHARLPCCPRNRQRTPRLSWRHWPTREFSWLKTSMRKQIQKYKKDLRIMHPSREPPLRVTQPRFRRRCHCLWFHHQSQGLHPREREGQLAKADRPHRSQLWCGSVARAMTSRSKRPP